MRANGVNNKICRGDKIFQRGSYISNIFVLGGPNHNDSESIVPTLQWKIHREKCKMYGILESLYIL